MAIVTSQLVASKVLQEWLLDKDTGLPLSSGIINLYEDDNRLIRKNWYFKQGTPGNYTYAALPNPMTLNASGAIVDSSGNEVTPYYYPFDEDDSAISQLYYITVYNEDGTLQFTRQGFPPINRADSVGEVSTLQNLIVNNQFWNQNVTLQSGGEVTLTLTNETNVAICPSNHDGYSMPDIRFLKDVTGANDTIVFKRFENSEAPLSGNVTPQFYIHISCSIAAAENYKFLQFPICLNTRNLEQEPYIFTVQTKLPPGAASRNITVQMLGYEGSGTVVSNGTNIGTITPTANWVKKTITQPQFAPVSSISPTEDDAYYLQLALPTNTSYDFYIAVPSLYLGTLSATNDFQSYDYIDSIGQSPRTGQVCQTFESEKLGWVPCNGGTIGNQGSGSSLSTTFTWPLYKLLYDKVNDAFAPVSGGRSAPANTAYGAFTNNRTLTLPLALADVLMGANPEFETSVNFTVNITTTTVTFDTGADTVTFAALGNLTKGSGVRFTTSGTLPTPLVAGTTYYIGTVTVATAQLHYNQQTAIDGVLPIDLGGAPAGTHTCVNNDTKLTLSTATTLAIGTPLLLNVSGGSLPTGLTALPNAVYYVGTKNLSTTTITLSNTYENAVDGYDLNFFSAGSGTFAINSALGADTGESRHTLTEGEMPSHTHSIGGSSSGFLISNGTTQVVSAADSPGNYNIYEQNLTNTTGQSDSHNIMQRSRMVNVFLKL